MCKLQLPGTVTDIVGLEGLSIFQYAIDNVCITDGEGLLDLGLDLQGTVLGEGAINDILDDLGLGEQRAPFSPLRRLMRALCEGPAAWCRMHAQRSPL